MADIRWTPLLVEARIVEAVDVLRRLPEQKVRGYFGAWPEIVHDFADKVGLEPTPMRRPPPSAGAITRMDETLTWMAWLDPVDAQIIWLRAAGLPWKIVCARVGMARTATHQHWMYGLCIMAWKLNGRRLPRNLSRRQVIEQTQSA